MGARPARPSREAVEKASTKAGKRRRPESQTKLKTKSEAKASLTAAEKDFIYIYIYLYTRYEVPDIIYPGIIYLGVLTHLKTINCRKIISGLQEPSVWAEAMGNLLGGHY